MATPQGIAVWGKQDGDDLAKKTIDLVMVECMCGLPFGVPRALYTWATGDGRGKQTIYCPLGHSFVYSGKSEEDRLRDQKARLEARLDQERAAVEHERRRRAAVQGHLTRTRNRIARGVCPCCNRSFENLHRHMKAKHPDYPPADPTATV